MNILIVCSVNIVILFIPVDSIQFTVFNLPDIMYVFTFTIQINMIHNS